MKILLLTRYGPQGASSRLRFFQFLPFLREAGIACTVHSLFKDVLLSRKYETGKYPITGVMAAYSNRIGKMMKRCRFNLVWIEKEALPWMPAWLESWLLRGVPYVLDYDDAVFHNYDLHESLWLRRFLGHRIDVLMASARLVVCGNDYLAQRARDAGAPWVEVLPTAVDLDRYSPHRKSDHEDNIPRIVWIGSPTSAKCIKLIHEQLLALSECCRYRLRVIGVRTELPGVDVEYVNWSEETEVSLLQGCQVGVMPLLDSPWERGKCGYKLVQYMACGLPVVASPVGLNSVIVREGINGFLANCGEDWVVALEALLRDIALRQRMGNAGRQDVEEKYCIQQVAPYIVKWLRVAGAN